MEYLLQSRIVADIYERGAPDRQTFPSRQPVDDSARKDTLSRTDIAVEKDHFSRRQSFGHLAANGVGIAGRLALANGLGAGQFGSSLCSITRLRASGSAGRRSVAVRPIPPISSEAISPARPWR